MAHNPRSWLIYQKEYGVKKKKKLGSLRDSSKTEERSNLEMMIKPDEHS